MTIKYKAYSIEPEGANFNLYKDVERTNKGNKVIVPVPLGYGLKFSTCIDRIIKDTLAERSEVVSLTHFVDEYRKIQNEITDKIQIL